MYVITGGGSGIGRALAHALAAREKRVLVVGRRTANLLATATFSSLISTFTTSVSTQEGRDALVTYLNETNTLRLDGLIHNAGTIAPIAPLADIKEDEWEKAMATHVNAPLFLTQQLLNKLDNARVLMIGTGVAYFPVASWSAYCVSKAALAMLTRCWHLESSTTEFTSVLPGIVDTDMQSIIRHSENMQVEQVNFYATLKQQGRLLNPVTVAQFLAWLLLDVKKLDFSAQEWDIYNTEHHPLWLTAPHTVPHWEN